MRYNVRRLDDTDGNGTNYCSGACTTPPGTATETPIPPKFTPTETVTGTPPTATETVTGTPPTATETSTPGYTATPIPAEVHPDGHRDRHTADRD